MLRSFAYHQVGSRTLAHPAEIQQPYGVLVLTPLYDPWEIRFTRRVEPGSRFQNGPWARRSVEEAIEETIKLGRLPDGLELQGHRVKSYTGSDFIYAVNNRTFYVLQEADRAAPHLYLNAEFVNDVDSPEVFKKWEGKLKSNKRKGGLGLPILRTIDEECP